MPFYPGVRWCFLLIPALVQMASGEADFWDMAPLRYSDTKAEDSIAELAAELASGSKKLEGVRGLERLRFVLRELGVPEESQALVFSKTSHQNHLIHPKNPRALYFSPEAYVGYVPGGAIELIVEDPALGPVFYVIDDDDAGKALVQRDTNLCMSCHGTTRTEGIPGMLVRSVFPNPDGHPLLAKGTTHVTHETPIPDRWGGYYITGRSSLPHLGNFTYDEQDESDNKARMSELADLRGQIDVSKYLRPTSDIIALMVLEHQCQMHNLLNAAAMQYRRSHYLGKAIDPQGDPDQGSAGRVADGMAERIVAWMFFKDEADLGDGVEGNEEFQKAFTSRFPRTKSGDSLADFQLYDRLFKNRCSYMVYSKTFRDLPPRVKWAVIAKMKAALAGEDPGFDWLKESERKRISGILEETLEGWK